MDEALGREPALTRALDTFGRWLHLKDDAPVLIYAATLVAHDAAGDPLWLLIVGPPSGGKTEILSSAAGVGGVVMAAVVTEAALLSGTSKKERAHDATGGLLRQIDESGVLLCKDFTSVLSQNKDTARAALAALREIYDGQWHRPVGTDGGKVLKWSGKCGFVGGVTPTIDRYTQILSALGDRFLLLRLPDADAEQMATFALSHNGAETTMRGELATAITDLVASADRSKVNRPLADAEQPMLIALATYVARARTAVERSPYTGEVLVMPQPEGTARLVLALRRLYGGLDAIGVERDRRWQMLARVALDCVPAARTRLLTPLLSVSDPVKTATLAGRADMVTKTARRYLEDLALLRIVDRGKTSAADNAPDLWSATDWLRTYWPPGISLSRFEPDNSPDTARESGTEKYDPPLQTEDETDVCAAPGCDQSPRHGLRTCWPHAKFEDVA